MNNTFYFLRHADVEKDPTIPAIRWHLSFEGITHAEGIIQSGVFDRIDLIFSSEEDKAFETALPIAKRNNLKIQKFFEFNELARGEKFLSKEEFESLKKEKLEDLDCNKDDGETGRMALKRFMDGLKKIDSRHEGKNILVVSHGTILAIYFAHLGNFQKEIFSRWQKMKFCAWGVVREGRLERDLF